MRRSALVRGVAVLLIGGIILSACGPRHPLGIDDADWQTMAPQQRLDAHARQADLDRAMAERRAAEAAARKAADEARAAELDARRQEARYGERLQCVLRDAEVKTGNRWRAVRPVAVDVVKGLEVELQLEEPSGRVFRFNSRAYASFDGQTLSLCRDPDGPRRSATACAHVIGLFEDFRRGMTARLDGSSFLRGTLRCSLAPAPGMPETIILDRPRMPL